MQVQRLSPHLRLFLIIIAVWTVPALLAATQQWLWRPGDGSGAGFGAIFLAQVPGWYLWACLTPYVLLLANRKPIRRDRLFGRLLVHGVASVGFMLFFVAIYLPISRIAAGQALPWNGFWGYEGYVGHFRFTTVQRGGLDVILYWLVLLAATLQQSIVRSKLRELRATALMGRLATAKLAAANGGGDPGSPAGSDPVGAARIEIRCLERVLYCEQGEIDWVDSHQGYSRVHTGSRSFLTRETMASLERRLDPARFVRIHRSSLVNVERVSEVQPFHHGDGIVVLSAGAKLRMSRARRKSLQDLLDNFRSTPVGGECGPVHRN